MNKTQKENEEKLFKAIQDLKDSIFGLKQPYIPLCYDISPERGYEFNSRKMRALVDELTETSKTVRSYQAEFAPILPLFFELCFKFLAAVCNPSDWIFVSIRKIANTLYRHAPGADSTFDRMLRNNRNTIDNLFAQDEFWPLYEDFSARIDELDFQGFSQCVKHTVETYIDNHHLNTLDHDQATQSIITRLNRVSSTIQRDVSRFDRMESVTGDDED